MEPGTPAGVCTWAVCRHCCLPVSGMSVNAGASGADREPLVGTYSTEDAANSDGTAYPWSRARRKWLLGCTVGVCTVLVILLSVELTRRGDTASDGSSSSSGALASWERALVLGNISFPTSSQVGDVPGKNYCSVVAAVVCTFHPMRGSTEHLRASTFSAWSPLFA